MKRNASWIGAALLAAGLFAGCGGDEPSGPAYAPFDGLWRGSVVGISVRLQVTDDNGVISGTGRLMAVQSVDITVDGEHDHPHVSFTGRASGFQNFEFDGAFIAADTVRGHADGSGFSNHLMILTRQ